jgi:hypothetical protein
MVVPTWTCDKKTTRSLTGNSSGPGGGGGDASIVGSWDGLEIHEEVRTGGGEKK